jgi:hypothetical protein
LAAKRLNPLVSLVEEKYFLTQALSGSSQISLAPIPKAKPQTLLSETAAYEKIRAAGRNHASHRAALQSTASRNNRAVPFIITDGRAWRPSIKILS